MAYDDLGNDDKLSSMRTLLSFQRTRMAADRTLMAIMRTALSMIGFGFTIYTFFSKLSRQGSPLQLIGPGAPARFGLALVSLGVLLLVLGIGNHYRYMRELRGQRQEFIALGLLSERARFPVSLTLITAFLLILVGLTAVLAILAKVGPFG